MHSQTRKTPRGTAAYRSCGGIAELDRAKDRMVEAPARGKTCATGAGGLIAQSVADIVKRHVKLTVEGIDRMYLNVVPDLQYEQGIIRFYHVVIEHWFLVGAVCRS